MEDFRKCNVNESVVLARQHEGARRRVLKRPVAWTWPSGWCRWRQVGGNLLHQQDSSLCGDHAWLFENMMNLTFLIEPELFNRYWTISWNFLKNDMFARPGCQAPICSVSNEKKKKNTKTPKEIKNRAGPFTGAQSWTKKTHREETEAATVSRSSPVQSRCFHLWEGFTEGKRRTKNPTGGFSLWKCFAAAAAWLWRNFN